MCVRLCICVWCSRCSTRLNGKGDPKGVIELKPDDAIDLAPPVDGEPESKFAFQIQTRTRRWLFWAQDDASRHDWIRHITVASGKKTRDVSWMCRTDACRGFRSIPGTRLALAVSLRADWDGVATDAMFSTFLPFRIRIPVDALV